MLQLLELWTLKCSKPRIEFTHSLPELENNQELPEKPPLVIITPVSPPLWLVEQDELEDKITESPNDSLPTFPGWVVEVVSSWLPRSARDKEKAPPMLLCRLTKATTVQN